MLTLIAQGETAGRGGPAVHPEATVKTHLLHIYTKLDVNDQGPPWPRRMSAACSCPVAAEHLWEVSEWRRRRHRACPPTGSRPTDRRSRPVSGVDRKGASIPYTSLNGHMTSSFLRRRARSCCACRRPTGRASSRYATTLHTAHGIVQKEFVDVPDALFLDTGTVARMVRGQPRLDRDAQAEAPNASYWRAIATRSRSWA